MLIALTTSYLADVKLTKLIENLRSWQQTPSADRLIPEYRLVFAHVGFFAFFRHFVGIGTRLFDQNLTIFVRIGTRDPLGLSGVLLMTCRKKKFFEPSFNQIWSWMNWTSNLAWEYINQTLLVVSFLHSTSYQKSLQASPLFFTLINLSPTHIRIYKMLSIRSILFAVAAFAIIASAIPTPQGVGGGGGPVGASADGDVGDLLDGRASWR